MSDDLVKRLQDYLDCRPWAAARTFDPTHPECLIAQSKDRIEKLEAALREIMNAGQSAVPDHWEARCLARDTARKALEGKYD